MGLWLQFLLPGCMAWKTQLTKMQQRRGYGREARSGVPVVLNISCMTLVKHSNVLGFRFWVKKVESHECPDKVIVKHKWDHV